VRVVPVRTSTMRIGADRRVGLKNSRDCDDRILERGNGGNRAAGAARIFKDARGSFDAEAVIASQNSNRPRHQPRVDNPDNRQRQQSNECDSGDEKSRTALGGIRHIA
jgi:hypothetical protein